jgi:hypothetical protein
MQAPAVVLEQEVVVLLLIHYLVDQVQWDKVTVVVSAFLETIMQEVAVAVQALLVKMVLQMVILV